MATNTGHYNKCFVCTKQVITDGHSSNTETDNSLSTFVLKNILDLPLKYETKFPSDLSKLRYCELCLNDIFNIQATLGRLEELEKQSLNMIDRLKTKLIESWEKSKGTENGSSWEASHSAREIKKQVAQELCRRTMLAMIGKIQTKQPGNEKLKNQVKAKSIPSFKTKTMKDVKISSSNSAVSAPASTVSTAAISQPMSAAPASTIPNVPISPPNSAFPASSIPNVAISQPTSTVPDIKDSNVSISAPSSSVPDSKDSNVSISAPISTVPASAVLNGRTSPSGNAVPPSTVSNGTISQPISSVPDSNMSNVLIPTPISVIPASAVSNVAISPAVSAISAGNISNGTISAPISAVPDIKDSNVSISAPISTVPANAVSNGKISPVVSPVPASISSKSSDATNNISQSLSLSVVSTQKSSVSLSRDSKKDVNVRKIPPSRKRSSERIATFRSEAKKKSYAEDASNDSSANDENSKPELKRRRHKNDGKSSWSSSISNADSDAFMLMPEVKVEVLGDNKDFDRIEAGQGNAVAGDSLVLTKPLGTNMAITLNLWMKDPEKRSKLRLILPEENVRLANIHGTDCIGRSNDNAIALMLKYHFHGCTQLDASGLLHQANKLVKEQKENVSFLIRKLPIVPKMHTVDKAYGDLFGLCQGLSPETSGGLLICLPEYEATSYVDEMEKSEDCRAWIIGDVVAGNRTARILERAKIIEVPNS